MIAAGGLAGLAGLGPQIWQVTRTQTRRTTGVLKMSGTDQCNASGRTQAVELELSNFEASGSTEQSELETQTGILPVALAACQKWKPQLQATTVIQHGTGSVL